MKVATPEEYNSLDPLKRRELRTLFEEEQGGKPTFVSRSCFAMMATAAIRWSSASRVIIKLKSNGNVIWNAAYDAGVLPDDFKLFDDDDDLVINASFSDIFENFSIEYKGTRYYCVKG